MASELVIKIVGDTKDVERAFKDTQQGSKRFGSAMKVGLGAAAAGFAGLAFAAKLGISEFLDSQKVMAQTNAVLKSTGSAAKVTADDVTALSEALMKKSGVDDEVIQSGENMLLTFTKIRNETGKGNDIFDQATKATLNLSVAMGKDMQSSAILVGKALNDPIKGMSALTKAGIQFTEEQKKTIKGLVASGDAMGAQKIILKELETQFGGSAEAAGKTFSGQMNIAKESALNFAGDVVAKVVPALADLVAFIRKEWPKIREIIEAVTRDIRAIWKQWGDEIMAVVNFVFPVILAAIRNVLKIIQGIIDVFVGVLTGDWQRAWDGIKEIVDGVLSNILLLLTTALTLLGKAAKAIGEAIFNGIKNAVTGIDNAVWKLVEGIGTKVGQMATTILGWGTSVGAAVKKGAVDAIVGIGLAAWNVIDNIGSKIVEMVATIIGWGTGIGEKIKKAVVDAIVGIGEGAWAVIDNVGAKIVEMATTIVGWGTSIGEKVKQATIDAVVGIAGGVWNIVNNIGTKIGAMIDTIKGWGGQIANAIKNGIANALEGLGDWLWDRIKGAISGLAGRIKGALPDLNPFGDARDPNMTMPPGTGVGANDLMGASPVMAPFAALGRSLGLHVTSGLRPGAVTANGTPSDHGFGKALDMADGPSAMAAFFMALLGNPAVKQAFYDPLGSIFAGKWSSYREGGHSDHVHVATYDQGGLLRPGWTMAYNGTGQNEYVTRGTGMGGTVVNVYGDVTGTEIIETVRREINRIAKQSGRTNFV